jgi:hypothetical protein
MTGGNSIKTDGSIRTIQGFSDNNGKLKGEKWYDIYTSYWNDDLKYADTFTSNACLGKGDFALSASGASPVITSISQGEGCMKGAQYQNMPMYVIHEMEAAIADCKANIVGKHWDEAVAFYSGSLTLNGADIGVFQYGLAEKRCKDFNTCNSKSAVVNAKVLDLFAAGRDMVPGFQCSGMETTKEALVKQFAVPLVQGVLKYFFLADTSSSEKEKAELWAFAAAILPMVSHYNPSAAVSLRANSYILNPISVPSGFVSAKASLEAAYPAMGLSCAEVGGYVSQSDSSRYAYGMEPCSDASTQTQGVRSNARTIDSTTPAEAGVIVLAVVLFILLLSLLVYCCRKTLCSCCSGHTKGDDCIVGILGGDPCLGGARKGDAPLYDEGSSHV